MITRFNLRVMVRHQYLFSANNSVNGRTGGQLDLIDLLTDDLGFTSFAVGHGFDGLCSPPAQGMP